MNRSGPVCVVLSALMAALPANAGPWCDHYRECCYQLVALYQEQPIPDIDIVNFQAACDLANVLEQMGSIGENACFEAEEAISDAAHQHWLEGRLGAYPSDACWAHPLSAPDDADTPPDE